MAIVLQPLDSKCFRIRRIVWMNLGRGIGAFKMTSLSLMMECLGGFFAINLASAVYFLPSSTNLSISWNAGLSEARERSITDLFPRRIPTRFCAFFTQLKVTRRSFGNILELWLRWKRVEECQMATAARLKNRLNWFKVSTEMTLVLVGNVEFSCCQLLNKLLVMILRCSETGSKFLHNCLTNWRVLIQNSVLFRILLSFKEKCFEHS